MNMSQKEINCVLLWKQNNLIPKEGKLQKRFFIASLGVMHLLIGYAI